MSKHKNLTEIWDVYKDSLIKESKDVRKKAAETGCMQGGLKNFGTKTGPGAVDADSKQAEDIQNKMTSDIAEIDGFEPAIDPKKMKKKDKKDNLYTPDKFSAEQFDEKLAKRYSVDINNNMKSTFDKLFEEVMGDDEELDALGIELDEVEDTAEGVDADDITITLDRDMAKGLCDLLQAAMGDEAEDAGAEDYEEMEEDDMDDEEDTMDEAVDAEDLGHPLVNQKDAKLTKVGAGSNKVKSTTTGKASSDKASADVKKQQGVADEDLGEPLVNQKKGHPTKIAAGSNKVHATKANTVGASLFD
jgi:hypothetical protein